jgi:hypothetical protein
VCVQVIVVTHELSDPKHFDDYLLQALTPAVPLLFYGRSRKAEPVCDPDKSLWHWWKDRRRLLSCFIR